MNEFDTNLVLNLPSYLLERPLLSLCERKFFRNWIAFSYESSFFFLCQVQFTIRPLKECVNEMFLNTLFTIFIYLFLSIVLTESLIIPIIKKWMFGHIHHLTIRSQQVSFHTIIVPFVCIVFESQEKVSSFNVPGFETGLLLASSKYILWGKQQKIWYFASGQ